MHVFAFSSNTQAHDLGSYIFNAMHVRAKEDPRNVQGMYKVERMGDKRENDMEERKVEGIRGREGAIFLILGGGKL